MQTGSDFYSHYWILQTLVKQCYVDLSFPLFLGCLSIPHIDSLSTYEHDIVPDKFQASLSAETALFVDCFS